jgi:hypothetical protein
MEEKKIFFTLKSEPKQKSLSCHITLAKINFVAVPKNYFMRVY